MLQLRHLQSGQHADLQRPLASTSNVGFTDTTSTTTQPGNDSGFFMDHFAVLSGGSRVVPTPFRCTEAAEDPVDLGISLFEEVVNLSGDIAFEAAHNL